MIRRCFLISFAALSLAACGNNTPVPASETAPITTENAAPEEAGAPFTVSDAYVRAPLAGNDTTAAYLTITSTSDSTGRLFQASTDVADTVELHSHIMSGTSMSMQKVDYIEIPPNGSASLKPMGDHVMLFGVDQSLSEVDSVELTLVINVEGEPVVLTVDAPVRPLG